MHLLTQITQFYLFGDVFIQLMNGLIIADSPDILALSRFASMDSNAKNADSRAVFFTSELSRNEC